MSVRDGMHVYDVELELTTERIWIGRVLNFCEKVESLPINVSLAFGCVRPGPMEEIIRHGTELGVTNFFPLILEHSNRRPATSSSRWTNIAESACAQSGRFKKPLIHDPANFQTFLENNPVHRKLIHLSLRGEARFILDVLDSLSADSIIFVIGPEGGFSDAEHALLLRRSSCAASLGFTKLRTETACVVAAGIAMNWGFSRRSG